MHFMTCHLAASLQVDIKYMIIRFRSSNGHIEKFFLRYLNLENKESIYIKFLISFIHLIFLEKNLDVVVFIVVWLSLKPPLLSTVNFLSLRYIIMVFLWTVNILLTSAIIEGGFCKLFFNFLFTFLEMLLYSTQTYVKSKITRTSRLAIKIAMI
jgi:hypothetical protein